MFKAIGSAAYSAAAKTGIAAGSEQPPYPCALPLRTINDPNDVEEIQRLAEEVNKAARDLLGTDNQRRRAALERGTADTVNRRVRWDPDSQWKPVDYKDPDVDGDCVLMSKPHVGMFNFAKATMTFRDCDPEPIMDTITGEDFATRKKFSADLSRFEIIARPTPTTNIQYHEYHAPPPVASRHLIYLFERLYLPEEDTHLVYGCSIDYPLFNKYIGKRTVRAICLWCWEFTKVGSDTLATYASCMSPNGWAPTFVVGWMKNEIGRELTSIRRVVYQLEHGKVLKPVSEKKLDGADKKSVGCHSSIREITKASIIRNQLSSSSAAYERGDALDAVRFEDERPQQEEELAWRELEENEELMLF